MKLSTILCDKYCEDKQLSIPTLIKKFKDEHKMKDGDIVWDLIEILVDINQEYVLHKKQNGH